MNSIVNHTVSIRLANTNYNIIRNSMIDAEAYMYKYGYERMRRKHPNKYRILRLAALQCRRLLQECGAYDEINDIVTGKETGLLILYGGEDDGPIGIFNCVDAEHASFLPCYVLYMGMRYFRSINVEFLNSMIFIDTRIYRRMVEYNVSVRRSKEEYYEGDPIKALLEAKLSDAPIRRLPVELIRAVDSMLF